MRAYIGLFKVRFQYGLQYRTSAVAGMLTQFIWGILTILFFRVLNQSIMSQSELSTYIWVGQAFLALSAIWVVDQEIFHTIEDGSVSYDLAKPIDLYMVWFIRNLANRCSRAFLRSIPMLLLTSCLPKEYRIGLPNDVPTFLFFLVALIISTLLVVSINMFMYIITIYTRKSIGVRMIFVSIFDLLDGKNIPYPFFPSVLQSFIKYTFFFGLQTTPILIYLGKLSPVPAIMFQLMWLFVLVGTGKYFFKKACSNIEVFGG